MTVPTPIDPIRSTVKYIAELFRPDQWPPVLSTAPNNFDRSYNIYHFSISETIPTELDEYDVAYNYWRDVFGGTFDNPFGYGIQLFMGKFLTQVFLVSNLLAIENSFYVDEANDLVYMNIPKKPWQYYTEYAALYGNPGSTFSSAPKNENNLSDVRYGPVPAQVRLKPPSLNNKLSNTISGINVYNSFSVELDNTDGMFDAYDILGYFNTPLQVSKASFPVESIQDFNRIRYGLVDNIEVSFDRVKISARDQLYALNTDFCAKFTSDDYPNIEANLVNNDIPVGWGVLIKIPVFEVDRDTSDPCTWIDYIALDPDYITAVTAVYDSDGNSLTHSFSGTTGKIRVTEVDGDGVAIDAESATVTGNTDNAIGEIITFALEENENLPYIVGIWDTTETDAYIALSSDINLYFDGGTTRDLVEAALKNDLAYLIQKNDGLLTLRQWGQEYDYHQIPEWLMTQQPAKEFKDAYKFFLSTTKIEYQKNYADDKYERTYIDDSLEREIFERYRRSFTPTFETDLATANEVIDLSDRLLARFGEVRETLKVGVGVDTFGINLLDTIAFEATVNDRVFSPYSTWIVKEADPGQDIIVLEGQEISYILTFDGVDAYLDDNYLWAVEGDIA